MISLRISLKIEAGFPLKLSQMIAAVLLKAG